MRWGIGILTWNAPTVCQQTLTALRAGLTDAGDDTILILDNGSDRVLALLDVDITRCPTNLGAGGGLSELVRRVLERPIDALLFLEDDWELVRPLSLAAIAPLIEASRVGQLRLGERPPRPGQKYYTYGLEGSDLEAAAAYAHRPFELYAHGAYQEFPGMWSNNPFACRRDIAERFLLTGKDELRMARPFQRSGLLIRSTTPGHFRHGGTIRDRRDQPGWKK